MLTSNAISLLRVMIVSGLLTAATSGALAPGSVPERTERFSTDRSQTDQKYGKLPLSFEVNRGQTDKRVKFLSRGNGYSLFLTSSGAVLTLRTPGAATDRFARTASPDKKPAQPANPGIAAVIRMELPGASRRAVVTGDGQLPGNANYLIGNDPSKWRTNISTYARVCYTGIYPGIDLVYYGNQRRLEYDFVVAPHADPDRIRLQFAGADRLRITAGGDLALSAEGGEIVFHKPVVYQQRDGRRQPVSGAFALLANRSVGFKVGSYDHSQPLVVDPVLVYSTYLGGMNLAGDQANAIVVDKEGNAYLTGSTGSKDFPLSKGAFQKVNRSKFGVTAFVTKLNAAGTALIYSTYLGGTQQDVAYALAVDQFGNAHVGGFASSPDFPVTKGAFQTKNRGWNGYGGFNAFVSELNATGTALVHSTYLGGSGTDRVNGLAIDSLGNTYVTGGTSSPDFPITKGAFQKTNYAVAINQSTNAFVTKLNPTLSGLIYSTFLGGSGYILSGDAATALALDSEGNAYVAGYTNSTDFPVTKGAYQTKNRSKGFNFGKTNGFITKLNAAGSALIYSTYLGGSSGNFSGDAANALAVDKFGSVYVTGVTASDDFPVTTGAFQTVNKGFSIGNWTGFITKLNPAGSALVYSTYLGGGGGVGGGDTGSGIVVDAEGNATVAGQTSSTDFPITKGALQTTDKAPTNTAFVSRLNATGKGLLYSTFLGGTGDESAYAITADALGYVYVTGETNSKDFPVTKGAFQTTNHAADTNDPNLFVTKMNLAAPTTTSLSSSVNPGAANALITFTATVKAASGNTVPTGSVAFSANGTALGTVALTSGKAHIAIKLQKAGIYIVEAVFAGGTVFASSSAKLSETIKVPLAAAPPVFSPAMGTYDLPQSVHLTDATKGEAIYYTTGGTMPTTLSARYITPAIKVSATQTIKAMAVAIGYSQSPLASADVPKRRIRGIEAVLVRAADPA